jgi:hypothetical protein
VAQPSSRTRIERIWLMHPNEYQERANALAAPITPEVEKRLLEVSAFLSSYLQEAKENGEQIDKLKKYIYNNRQNEYVGKNIPVAFINQRERFVEMAGLLHSVLGIIGEGAELAEAVLNYIENGGELDKVNINEELGDLDWYKVYGLKVIGFTNQQCMEVNLNKLEGIRYKNGYSNEAANNRDLETEREVLESVNAAPEDVNT